MQRAVNEIGVKNYNGFCENTMDVCGANVEL